MMEHIEINDDTKGIIVNFKKHIPMVEAKRLIQDAKIAFKDIPVMVLFGDVDIYALQKEAFDAEGKEIDTTYIK